MDLAKFAQMPAESGGAFLKFTPNDNIKIVRFLYPATVGTGEDYGIQCRQKLYDPSTKKVIWDAPEGKWTMTLKVAVYSSKSEFATMSWDRSAVFGRDTLLPLFESAGGRICDQVYKVTCSKAGTLDAKFSFFPVKDSESYAMPNLLPEETPQETTTPAPAQPTPAPVAQPATFTQAPQAVQAVVNKPATAMPAPTPKKKNFWDDD